MDTNKKSTSQKRMEGFPVDGHPWRIEWIGGLSYSIDDEPKIRIYLSRLKSDTHPQKVLINGSLFQDELGHFHHTYFDAKIGFIQLLKLGSVWVDGVQQLQYKAVTEHFKIVLDDTELVSLARTGANEIAKNVWENILTDFQYRITDGLARRGSWVVVINNHPKYKKIIIPSSVIFQRCYVTSPKAATQIVFGQINKLIDTEQSGFVDGEPNVFRVCIYRDYKNSEAPMLINLITDPAGKENLQRLRRNLVTSQVRNEKTIPLRVNFPFSNLMDMNVLGRVIIYKNSITGENEAGFFVSEIMSLQTDFQFDTFIPVRKNSGKKGLTQDDELIEAFGVKGTVISSDQPDLTMTCDDVSSYLEAVQIFEPIGVEPNSMTEIKDEKEYQKYKNKGFISVADGVEGGTGVSTGPSTGTKAGANELDVVLAPPVELDDFFEVLNLLAEKGFSFDVLAVCNSVQTAKGVVNYFPKKINGVRSWHFRENSQLPRAFVAAECSHDGVWHYLIDVEAKGISAMSMAYIRSSDGQKISENSFETFMRRVAKANGWSPLKRDGFYAKNWHSDDIRHSRSRTLASVIVKIINCILR